MRNKIFLSFITFLVIILPIGNAASNDYIIYSVVQDIPMGEPNEIVKKNYYLDIGSKQGVQKGTILDVLRHISRQDPYGNKKRFQYKVSIGKLKVIHSEESSSIAILEKFNNEADSPLYEIDNFMIGDKVLVDVN